MKDKIILKGLKIDFQKLLQTGFTKENNYYQYKTKIINAQFYLIIKIDKDYVVTSDVIEISTNEKYMPYYVSNASGNFVGEMRKEYSNIIEEIKNRCCIKNSFQSEYANLIIKYVKDKYNDELEYLWEKFPDVAIWRKKITNGMEYYLY